MSFRGAGAVAAAVALSWTAEAWAQQHTVAALPTPDQRIRRGPPPLTAATSLVVEQRVPPRLSATERVRVALDPTGRPLHVVVVQRLEIAGKGDYSFVVPGPIEDVLAAPGSESEPGLRANAVVWQGFARGRRMLAAEVTLRARDAAAALPVRISVRRGRVRVANAATAVARVLASPVPAASLARALDAARAGLRAGRPAGPQFVPVAQPVRMQQVQLTLPLRISGDARFTGGGATDFRRTLGSRAEIIRGNGELRSLELRVAVPTATAMLTAPRLRSWRTIAARGGLGRGAGATTRAARLLGSAALARQFHAFLANPNAAGPASTSYEFRLAVREPLSTETRGADDRDRGWVTAALAIGLALAAAAAVVVWAHS